jgi:mannitol/fructose-specific phosphotransferase system IIA component (Ntr-type)
VYEQDKKEDCIGDTMHPVINHMIQLQELTLIRDEQLHAKRTEHLEQLNASIAEMAAALPANMRTQFEKLQKRDPIAVAPISDSNCSVCGIKLATSLVQMIRSKNEMHACPSCSRILFMDDSAPRRVGQRTRRHGPRKVGIARFSSEVLMIPDLSATNAEEAIQELAEKMENEGFVLTADKMIEAALRREALCSTALEDGLAFPHVRSVEGGGLTLALGTSKKGFHFHDERGLTRIVCFIVIPTAASAFYLKLLAGLTKSFLKDNNRSALLKETDPVKMWKTLCRVTRTTVK